MSNYTVIKNTREGCSPHKEKKAKIDAFKSIGFIRVSIDDVKYELDILGASPQLVCLIADSLPEPIRFSELESLGFKRV